MPPTPFDSSYLTMNPPPAKSTPEGLAARSVSALLVKRLPELGLKKVVMALTAVITDDFPLEIKALTTLELCAEQGGHPDQLRDFLIGMATRKSPGQVHGWMSKAHCILDVLESRKAVILPRTEDQPQLGH